MAKITIEGSAGQVSTAMGYRRSMPRTKALKINQRRRDEIIARRKIVREAFDAIRYDKSKAAEIDRLAGSLGGRYPLDQQAMDLAQHILTVSNGESR